MRRGIQSISFALACGATILLAMAQPAAAQMRNRGLVVNPFPPQNPFLNYPLTPYMSVGQYIGIRNTLAYAAMFGRLPPGYNAWINYPLTPYLGVGQAAGILATLGGGYPGSLPATTPFNPLQTALSGGIPYPVVAPIYSGSYGGYGVPPIAAGTSSLSTSTGAGYANTRSQLTTSSKPA